MPHIERERGIGLTGAQLIERLALPRVHLAHVLAELDRQSPLHETEERSAGADLRQLPVVADEHELAVGTFDMVEQLDQLPRRQHPGLVDHEHSAVRKPFVL